MRIGIMGGSFNPPHLGHVQVARTAVRRLALDRLWVVVTPGNPLKSSDGLAPLQERMAELRSLLPGRAFVVTGFEADLPTRYTADTLGFLVRRLPGVRLVWVMGADNLAGFHTWQNWRAIARMMPVAVVDRPGWRLKAIASPAGAALAEYRLPENSARLLPGLAPPAWVFLTTRLSKASSTALRQARPSR